jgi:hypothetical protein
VNGSILKLANYLENNSLGVIRTVVAEPVPTDERDKRAESRLRQVCLVWPCSLERGLPDGGDAFWYIDGELSSDRGDDKDNDGHDKNY